MEYSWERITVDMAIEGCEHRFKASDVTIFAHWGNRKEQLGAVHEKKDRWKFVFNSAAQAVSHGVSGFSSAISPYGCGSQSIDFPKDCATTDQEIGEFTISLLKAGRKNFMESTPETLNLR